MASKLFKVSSGTEFFYFKASDAIYTGALLTSVGIEAGVQGANPIALVSQSELVRCGLCARIQVRLAGVGGKPPSVISVLVHTESIGEAMAYFNNATKPTIGTRTVLGANFKRDKFYV
jgi:hypothetical protein